MLQRLQPSYDRDTCYGLAPMDVEAIEQREAIQVLDSSLNHRLDNIKNQFFYFLFIFLFFC